MPNFTLKAHRPFVFNIEGDATEYKIPAFGALSFDEVSEINAMEKLKDPAAQGKSYKAFVLRYVPELESLGLGDVDYILIFNAYVESQQDAKLGE
ncbi:MAG: hypothetical protein J5535_05740 [Firmicutes bacterium]|nr:hypothetical protein [Bacillota bacterium]